MKSVDDLLAQVVEWAKGRSDVLAVALVGSHARGEARAGSDVDLVIVLESVAACSGDDRWLAGFGTVASVEEKDYGIVQSRIVRYEDGTEVEWGLADRRWCTTAPLDPGTAGVIAAGIRILHDPHGLVGALDRAVRES